MFKRKLSLMPLPLLSCARTLSKSCWAKSEQLPRHPTAPPESYLTPSTIQPLVPFLSFLTQKRSVNLSGFFVFFSRENQPQKKVSSVTYWGAKNPWIPQEVLDVNTWLLTFAEISCRSLTSFQGLASRLQLLERCENTKITQKLLTLAFLPKALLLALPSVNRKKSSNKTSITYSSYKGTAQMVVSRKQNMSKQLYVKKQRDYVFPKWLHCQKTTITCAAVKQKVGSRWLVGPKINAQVSEKNESQEKQPCF